MTNPYLLATIHLASYAVLITGYLLFH